jgi:hypothetical protein
MGLLDPRFNYVPAAATDVAATWRRFGFNPGSNEERRARLRRGIGERSGDEAPGGRREPPTVVALARINTRY